MISLFSKLKSSLIVVFSVATILLCIPPFNLWWLSFFTLTPLFLVIEKRSYKMAFANGTLFGFLFYWGIFHWVIPSVASVSKIHWAFSSLICLSVFLLIGLAYGGLFLLIKYSLKNWLLITPFILPAFEFLALPVFPIGIGYVWGASLIGAQIADIGGIYFLSFVTTLYGLLGFALVQKRLPIKHGAILLSSLLLCHFGYGYLRYSSITNNEGSDTIKVMIIQPAISPIQKRDQPAKTYHEVMAQLIPAIRENKDTDLIVLPESIFVPTMNKNDRRLAAFKTVLLPHQAICWGCNTTKDNQHFNSIGFLDNAQNAQWKYYQKQNLLLIGEHIPFLSNFPDLLESVEKATHINQFTPGKKLVGFTKNNFKILPSICFENMFSVIMAKKIKELNGADLLLNISEDGWFGDTNAQAIHYFVTKLRAIEFRRPLIRSLNIGISAVIDERGVEISQVINNGSPNQTKTNPFEKSIALCEIKKKSCFSFYAAIGYLFPYICALIMLFVLGQGLRHYKAYRKSHR